MQSGLPLIILTEMNNELIRKYNIPGPRYTSYPTVPYWDKSPSINQWKKLVSQAFVESNKTDGISIYIHLPYCESLCTYCGCNTRITVNHEVERPYMETLLKEWNIYKDLFDNKPNIQEIHLGGGTPTFFSPENLKYLIEGITSGSIVSSGAEFGFEAHPKNTTASHLEMLNGLGFNRLSLGIQDFDPVVQEAVNRIQPFELVKTATEKAREIGYISVNFDLIYGLPFQKKRSVEDTINKVLELKPDRIAFYSYAHVPWIKPGQRKFTEADLPSDEEKRGLYELGKEMLINAGYNEIGMDHFALPTDALCLAVGNKTLHRNFMGYTPHYTRLMVGLGVSSISDTWTCFAQNHKKVEEYMSAVELGELPIFRGHVLNEEDLFLRKHILNIMCNYETSWEEQNGLVTILEGNLKRLDEMISDGLVEVKSKSLKVTQEGKPFLRNVCMAFDARMWRKQPDEQIFSKTI